MADSSNGAALSGGAVGSAIGCSGASSTIRWALVPEIPNEETAARRGRSPRCHGWGSVRSFTSPASQSTCGDGASTWSVGGSRPWRSASTILITPPTPAAAWAWPMFDFSEPSHSGPSARSWP